MSNGPPTRFGLTLALTAGADSVETKGKANPLAGRYIQRIVPEEAANGLPPRATSFTITNAGQVINLTSTASSTPLGRSLERSRAASAIATCQ